MNGASLSKMDEVKFGGNLRDRIRPQAGIQKACSEFEGVLLNEVLAKLRETFSLQGEGASDPGSKTLAGLANQALCGAVMARGGLGLASLIRNAVGEKNR